jgi:SpoVK/Ycf46/Vps4 family AAA+-type ATPase
MMSKKAKGLDVLAQQLHVKTTSEQGILPPGEMAVLRQIAGELKLRQADAHRGASRPAHERSGVVALFTGPSGPSKTMAAGVLANDLGRNLYRVQLSAVVSTYSGETEQNLDQLFAEAERSQAILFFDEADALFGTRNEVKDAHDRYANLDVADLVQRLESFNGLAILATNSTTSLDESFLRRLRYSVQIP